MPRAPLCVEVLHTNSSNRPDRPPIPRWRSLQKSAAGCCLIRRRRRLDPGAIQEAEEIAEIAGEYDQMTLNLVQQLAQGGPMDTATLGVGIKVLGNRRANLLSAFRAIEDQSNELARKIWNG